eukprot:2224935-Amphidinium_carterae.1
MRAEAIASAGSACTGHSEVAPANGAHGAEGRGDMPANTSIPSHGAGEDVELLPAEGRADIQVNSIIVSYELSNSDQPPATVGTSLGEGAATVPSQLPMVPLTAGPNHVAESLPTLTHDVADLERRAARSLARSLRANSLTTVQCFGLDEQAALADLVLALNAEGLRGHYNYVSIPRSMHGVAEGYAFINFTCSESCAWLVERWGGLE